MHKLGSYALILGAVLTIVGLVAGFGLMFAGDDGLSRLFLGAVPVGFLLGFTGIVMTLLNPPPGGD